MSKKNPLSFLGNFNTLKFLNHSSDVILAFFVVIIIMMIIIPVPPPIIDSFIALNLTISICLLMVSLYIQKAVHISIFPSLLLAVKVDQNYL